MAGQVVSVLRRLAGGLVSVFLLPHSPQGGEMMGEAVVGVRVVARGSGGWVRMVVKMESVFALRVALLAAGLVLLPGDRR